VVTSHDEDPDSTGEDLVSTKAAAELVRVKPPTVLQWTRRGHLPVAGRDTRGRPLFRPGDAARAERATRRGARRRHPDLADVLSGAVESAECVAFDPADLGRLVCAQDAADLAGVARPTVRTWVHRRHLRQATDGSGTPLLDDQGRALFRVRDVAVAEQTTSRLARTRAPRREPGRRGDTTHSAGRTMIEHPFESEV
jgi:hypothetical protein